MERSAIRCPIACQGWLLWLKMGLVSVQ